MKQVDRRIDWNLDAVEVCRRIRCSDSQPGVLEQLFEGKLIMFSMLFVQ